MSALDFKTSMDFAYGEPKPMAEHVVRVVAPNPGPYTFKGTNTYIVGERTLAIIDPGPDDERHYDALMRAVAGRTVSHVFITHTHRDHVDLLPRFVAATGAKTCGFGRARLHRPQLLQGADGDQFIDFGFDPDIVLSSPGAAITGDGWTLTAVPTPGHAPDHVCYALSGDEGVLFSGDHVMAWNTTVVAPPEGHLADYLASLETLIARTDQVYMPGHGGRVAQPQRIARAYLVHRRLREQAIFGAIRDGHTTIGEIVDLVYRGLDPRLVQAARLSVQAHVEHLIDQGLVRSAGPLFHDRPVALAAVERPAPAGS